MKKISLLALILVLTISLTGCFNQEVKLYNAFTKMQDVTAIQSETTMGFTLETEGFSDEEQIALEQVAAMVNNTKIQMNQKMTQNEDKTVAKAEVDTKLDLGGMAMDMKVWVVADMSEKEPKLIEIIKMPQLLMSSMFPGEPKKEYLVYDIGEMMNVGNEDINFNEFMEFSKEFQPKLTEFVEEMQKNFKPGFQIVKQKDNKLIRDQNLEIYELKLDDAALKELIRYAVNYSLDNEATIEFIKGYMEVVMNIAMIAEGEKETAKAEVKEGLEELEKQLPEFKEKFNEFMDKYKDIKILGEKGIIVEYGINEKGYIVHEEGNIDLAIDLGKITKAIGEEVPEMEGIIKLGINYTSRNYNINSKVLSIIIPKVDKNNSINFMQMMEMQMKQMQQAPAPAQLP